MISGIVTLLLLLVFVGIWAWAWLPSQRVEFDRAARLVLDDEAGTESKP